MSFLEETDWTLINDFCGSPFWDANLTWNADYPQLTSCFEKTACVWLPGLFLWIFSCIDIFITFNSKNRNIPWNWKFLVRLIALGLLITLCGAEFIYNINRSEEIFPVDLYTPLIKLASLALCITLAIYHRKYGQRVSGLMFIYWFLVVLMGFSQFYSEIVSHLSSDVTEFGRIYYIIYYSLCFIIFFSYWFVDPPPKQSEYPKLKNPNPEGSASFPSRLTFAWFDSLIYKGYKRPLSNQDLWSMNHQDSAAQLYQVFINIWNKVYKNKTFKDGPAEFRKMENSVDFNGPRKVKSKPASVVPTLAKAFGGAFLFGSFLQLFDVFLTFASPELLKKVINFVSADDEPRWHGYFYAASLLLVTTLQSLFQSQFNQRIALVGLRMRTTLTTAIYRKALKLSSSARKDSTLGEIVNLMAVDSQTFMSVVPFLNTLWSAPLQIALSLYFLWQQLGPCVLVGLVVMLVMIPANAFFANLTKNLQVKQMKYKDERVKIVNEVLSGMKVLKLYGWEPSFEDKIQNIRQKEAKVLRRAAYLRAAVSFIWTCAPFLVSLLTFMTYVLIDETNVLDSAKVFVSLSLFNIMKGPLAMVPMVISNLVQATVSIKRINKFLNNDELDLNIISHDDKEDDPLVLEKGTFSWGPYEEPTLRNLNLRVRPGSLVAVVGAVGSGKSSFLSAFLGEMHKVSGRVNTKGSIGYVPQLAWIQNCTLQDNILFGRNLDNKKYHKVIDACALKADLQMLPGGDQTEIGEKGINVSGGQKQRISLARAVYSDCDVYFLDDPLSAVDSHVGKHIFDNVIGPNGVLKKKTRLLVTHGITFLPEVDLIVVLNNGEISEVGTYRELLERKGAFSEFLITHLQDIPEEELEEIDTNIKEDIIKSNPEFHRQISISRSMKSLSSSSSVSSVRNRRRASQLSQKSANEKPKKDKLIVEETAGEGRVKWNVYSKYIRAVGWFLFFSTAILSVATQSLLIGSNLWLSRWSDDQEAVVNGSQDVSKRNMYLGIYSLFGIFQTLSTFFSSLAWYVGCVNAGILLHYLLLVNIMRSPMSFFDTTPQGRILNRFSKEIDVIDNLIPFVMKQFFSMSTPVAGTIIVISYSTPIFMALILPIGVFYYFLQKFYIASSQQLRRIESISRSPVFSHFSESVTGAPLIRAYGAQKRFIKESEMKIDLNQSCSFSSIIAARWLSVRLQMIGNLIIFSATLFAIIGKDSLSPGIVGLSVSYTLQITGALNFLVMVTADVENNIVSVERIKEYTITPQEAAWEITPSLVGPDWPQEGKMEFIDYQVRYREGLDLVLKGINLVIKGGEKVGIVGRTGAGKSSITLCLFRIIESAGGKIQIDGIDIAKLGLHALRSRLTIIPQDPVLFSGSLRMNLDPFGRYNDEQVWRALELAHLKHFVKALPAGLQHEVTEGGENISVGQRQLICLARALLRKTKILILDEATAAVDLETDDFIQKTIRSEFADCTVLTIAHRINTIMDSDRVLVLDQGRVVEFDSPSELLKNKSSIFHSMAHDAGLV